MPLVGLTESSIRLKYGQPGDIHNLTVIKLPYPMRIAWDMKSAVRAMQCHKLLADSFLNVFNDLQAHYTYKTLVELNIDVFGGCYNFRQMRGGQSWSRHSWGIAIDLDPVNNGLHVPWKSAEFSREAYAPMVDIFYKHGFYSYGKEKNYDAMHFEINS
jgi:hypothetical protein